MKSLYFSNNYISQSIKLNKITLIPQHVLFKKVRLFKYLYLVYMQLKKLVLNKT